MSKQRLLKDALFLCNHRYQSGNPYETIQEQIRQEIINDRIKNRELNREEFNNLVFMEPPSTDSLLGYLAPKNKSRTLTDVADRLLEVTDRCLTGDATSTPIEIFKCASNLDPWFESCFIISARFNPKLLGDLLVRPLYGDDKKYHSNPENKLYIDDGNHRALVYIVFLKFDVWQYELAPVNIIQSTDFFHHLPWGHHELTDKKLRK